ncbi:hypothetical protein D9M73_123080 [compost metagenome]
MLEAVGVFEVIERFVEHEVRLALNIGQALLQARIQRIETLVEGLQVALIAHGIVRIGGTQVSRHFRGDDPGVDRRQPQMCIQAAWAMIVVVVVGFFGVGVAIFGKTAQFHAWQILHGHAGQRTTIEHARQETLHVRADPVQQVHRLHLAYVGRAQCIVVRRGTRWQQDLRNRHAVLHRCGDQLQGLDAGKDLDLGLRRTDQQKTCEKCDKDRKKTGHDDHSKRRERVT